MTRNIAIAAAFTFLTAVLLAGIFLREKPRLNEASNAVTAEHLERGARDFEQYCATCHGLAGQGGVGPRLNNIEARKTADGSMDGQFGIKNKYGTLRNYIEATLYSGVRGQAMPAFGAQGILRQDQIENITSYVLSWNSPYTDTDDVFRGLPTGVAARANEEATKNAPTPDPNANPVDAGKLVFQANCTSCHNMNDKKLVGPGLGGLFQPGGTAAFGTNLPNGKPVNDANVAEWIRKGSVGFSEKIPSVDGQEYGMMPGFPISDQDMPNLITWLKVHNRDGSETADAAQLRKGGQQQQGNLQNNTNPGAQNVPTVVPTGQAQPNTAPNSQGGNGNSQQPTPQVNTTADAESTDATATAQDTATTTP